VELGSEEISDAEVTVNPAWRTLHREVRKQHDALKKARAQFAAASLTEPVSEAAVTRFAATQGQQQRENRTTPTPTGKTEARTQGGPTSHSRQRSAGAGSLHQIAPRAKALHRHHQMISYRAETSMVAILREKMSRADDARALLRQIYDTDADLIPDLHAGTLTVKLHHLTQSAHDQILRHLCDQLNETETIFPDTQLRLCFQVGSG
jgi:hypothetical protein